MQRLTRFIMAALAFVPAFATASVRAAPAPTLVTACPTIIAKPGLYEMNATLGASGDCITIKARNVTLGIDGFIVNNGAAGTGIGIRIARGAIGAVIRGGATHDIEQFAVDVEDDAGDAVIGDILVQNPGKTAMVLNGASSIATMVDDVYVGGSSASGSNGILVTSPAGVRMVDTSVYGQNVYGYGITLDAAAGPSLLAGVTSAENAGTNIAIKSSGNVFSFCSEGFGKYGIVIAKGATDNLVTGCSSSGFQAPSVKDAVDNNSGCGGNAWFDDTFASKNRSCINNPPGGTAVSSCETISSGGGYYLTGNLVSKRGDCLDITAANVTLFLANRTISGAKTGIGLHVFPAATGFRGIGGRNGSEIYGFSVGAEIDANGAVFDDTGADNASDTGILVKSANDVTLGANDGTGNKRFGYHFLDASRTLLHNFSALSNGVYGVFLEHASGTLLDQFVAGKQNAANAIAGIYLGCSLTGPGPACPSHPSVTNTIAHGNMSYNTEYGLVADAGSDRNVLANLGNEDNGIDDAYDANANCADNLWFYDVFTTSNDSSCMNQP